MNENEKKLDLENFGKSTLYVATEKRQLPEDRTEPRCVDPSLLGKPWTSETDWLFHVLKK